MRGTFCDPETGEVFENAELRTQEQRESYKKYLETKKEYEFKNAEINEKYKKHGAFVWFIYHSNQVLDLGITPDQLTKLIYLSTYLYYNNRLLVKKDKYMTKSHMKEILKVSERTFKTFWSAIVKADILKIDNEDGCLYINDKLFKRGKIELDEDESKIRLYRKSIRSLYEMSKPCEHKFLSYLFQAIPFVNKNYNIISHNPLENDLDLVQPMQMSEYYYNDKIDKIQSEKSAMEERYDAEINKIDEQIDALQKSNDEKQKEYDIEKARQELEKSQQRTRKTYGADGNVAYRQDDEAVAEAKQNLDDLLLEQTIENLETQKDVLETAKENESEQFKTQIEALQKQQETQDNIYSTLLEILETYKKPSVVESNANVWDTIYKDAENVQPDSDSVNVKGVDIDTTPIKENIVTQIDIADWLERLGANPAIINFYKNNIPNDITAKLTDAINTNGSKQFNEQHKTDFSASRDDYKINNQSQVINNNNTIGDVHIHNPVKDGKEIAREFANEFSLAVQRQMYTNLKK